MKNILLPLVALLLLSCFYSCKEEVLLDTTPSQFRTLEKIAAMGGVKQMLNEASGSIGITNLKPFGDQTLVSGNGPTEFYGSFFNEQGLTTHGSITMGEVSLSPNEFQRYQSETSKRSTLQSYFGGIQSITLYADSSNSDLLIQEDLYLPRELFVNTPSNPTGTAHLTQHSTLHWNPDPENPHGVFILIDFLPGYEQNQDIPATSYVAHQKLLYTEDTGSYQFHPKDFKKIPDGAHITLIVGRGDYVEVLGSDHKPYILFSFTAATAGFYIGPEK